MPSSTGPNRRASCNILAIPTWETKRNLADAGTAAQQMMKEIDTRMENPTTNTNTASESIEPNTAQVPEPAEPGPSTLIMTCLVL